MSTFWVLGGFYLGSRSVPWLRVDARFGDPLTRTEGHGVVVTNGLREEVKELPNRAFPLVRILAS